MQFKVSPGPTHSESGTKFDPTMELMLRFFTFHSYLILSRLHLTSRTTNDFIMPRLDETSLLSPHVDHGDTSCLPYFILMFSSLTMHALHASYMLFSFRTNTIYTQQQLQCNPSQSLLNPLPLYLLNLSQTFLYFKRSTRGSAITNSTTGSPFYLYLIQQTSHQIFELRLSAIT